MIKTKIKAPTKLSDAIDLALEDLEIIETQKKDYTVDMNNYHSPNCFWDDKCHVCFAGAVMSVTHQVPWEEYVEPYYFGHGWDKVFRALDLVRMGHLSIALEWMQIEKLSFNECRSITQSSNIDGYFPTYNDDKKAFKKAMKHIASELRKRDL